MADKELVGRPMEILLVEDGLMDARMTIEALRGGDVKHRLTLIRDGEEALEFLRRSGRFAKAPRPDLVLLDLMLPKMGGVDVLTEIRNHFEWKDMPVVVLTASDAAEDREQCKLLRVDDYVTKPVNLEKFLAVVKKLRRHWMDDVILPSVE